MRMNYKSKFNELTSTGWVVAGGVMVVFNNNGYSFNC